jgi:RHS repeat-associated protein
MGCQKLAYYENPVYGEKTVHAKKCANYSYFGARYYLSDVSIWLSVDPKASERGWLSPYNYCQNNPIGRTDPTGALDGDYFKQDGTYLGSDGIDDKKVYVVNTSANTLTKNECLTIKSVVDGGKSGLGSIADNTISSNTTKLSLNRDQLLNEARWIYGEGGSQTGSNGENTSDYYAWAIKNAVNKLGSLEKVMQNKMVTASGNNYKAFANGTYNASGTYGDFYDAQSDGFNSLYSTIPNSQTVISSVINADLNLTKDPTNGSYGWGTSNYKSTINGTSNKATLYTPSNKRWHMFGNR